MPHTKKLDPYAELGVPRDATQLQIKQAYRKVALASHPDRHANDGERFRRATQAYALLRDAERRQAFDRTGRWENERYELPELNVELVEALEIFARDFGRNAETAARHPHATPRAHDVAITIDVSYEEVEQGGRRTVAARCRPCAGTGAQPGTKFVRCTSCGGSGHVRQVRSSQEGAHLHSDPCDACHGAGRRPINACRACNGLGRSAAGETLDVIIPRGVADGDSLYALTDDGSHFVARVLSEVRWSRDGDDLYVTERIPYSVAVLGGTIEVALPGRSLSVVVAPGTPSGQQLRVSGEGLPLRNRDGRGDLLLTLHVAVPNAVPGNKRRAHSATARLIVDSAALALLCTALWLLARTLLPHLDTPGAALWWRVLGNIPAAAFALVPLAAGMSAGVLRGVSGRAWIHLLPALPLGLAAGAVSAMTGAAAYAAASTLAPGAQLAEGASVAALAALAVAVSAVFMFLLGDAVVCTARLVLQHSLERRERP